MTKRRFELLAVLLCAALFLVHAYWFRFTMDDAYISLQYARNLVEGHGLVRRNQEGPVGHPRCRMLDEWRHLHNLHDVDWRNAGE